jgi:tetratricopeptide (TPR) repeat protein
MEDWRPTLDEGLKMFEQRRFEDALTRFISIQDRLAPPGVDVHIYLCLRELKRYKDMIPYLESGLRFSPNDRNPEQWRVLGLLYLHNERSVEKAVEAWKRALELNPALAAQYTGLQIAYLYDSMKAMGSQPVIDFVDLETGNFSVRFSTE